MGWLVTSRGSELPLGVQQRVAGLQALLHLVEGAGLVDLSHQTEQVRGLIP